MSSSTMLQGTMVAVLLCLLWIAAYLARQAEENAPQLKDHEAAVLQNDRLSLAFDRKTGALTAIENKLTGETYQVQGDEFEVEAVQFHTSLADARLVTLTVEGDALKADYQSSDLAIQVRYTLRGHFVEKQMNLTSSRDYGLKRLILSRLTFSCPDLRIVSYRYPKFGRKPGEEPCCTFFGRTPKGGFFSGTEVPFDASTLNGAQVVLGYSPSLKVKAQEPLKSEPLYLGVYRRQAGEQESASVPLRSESDAMVAMASTILGPPRFGLVPMACGWHSEMEHNAYTEQSAAGDMKSLDFLAQCGIDWLSDSHPWGGETQKMDALRASDKYEPGPQVRKFLEHARTVGVKVAMWPTMTNTHPWEGGGRPFRADKPEWLMTPLSNGNCMGNKPFLEWLTRINLEGLATDYYKSWVMDGDFFGGMGWPTTVIPVKCPSDQHDHLPGDSNYACQRALGQLIENVRKHYPDTYIFTCRPAQDLGLWAMKNIDVCFTLVESGTGASNLAAGDAIRTWSRTRMQHEFLPHYLDQPLLFPSRQVPSPANWPPDHLDYILLSALGCSPNQLYYMPTKTGIPDKDKAEIRKWLDWGRKNIAYLKVRKDLPDWPARNKVDGNAHIIGQRGFVFLFNSNKNSLHGEFTLSEEGIGLRGDGMYRISQHYPAAERTVAMRYGETARWDIPGQTAVILEIQQDSTDPRLSIGDPVVVSQAPVGLIDWGPWQFPAIQRLPNGRLQIGYHIKDDSATAYGAQPGVAESEDNGNTWKEAARDQFPPPCSWTSKGLMLPNGDRLVQITLKSRKLEEVQNKLPQPFTTWTGDGLETTIYLDDKMPKELAGWRFARLAKGSSQWVEETANVRIPGAVRGATSGVLVFPFIQRIKIAPDGALWGFGHSLRVVDGALTKQLFVQFLHSKDHGRTWDLLSEIPYQPDKSADKSWDKREGFTEPDIAFLPNQSILCLIRTSDGNDKNGAGPLYMSRSSDNGKTWSKPAVFDNLGVWPTLLTLENGVTLASYGRPGLYVRATNDPAAELWGPKVTVVKPNQRLPGGDTCSYSDLIAIDGRTALIAYSDFHYPDSQGRQRKTILVRKITLAAGKP